MINVYLHNNEGVIKGLPADLAQRISDECSFEIKGARHSELYKKGRWDGRKRLFNKQSGTFPMGLWGRIRQILLESQCEVAIHDKRTDARDDLLDIRLSESVEERPYQIEAVHRAIQARRSVLQVATGGGKTVIASRLISELRCPTIFFVHTKDLLYQAKSSFEAMLEGSDVSAIGQVGDGVVDVQPVTVATMQTVSKFLGVKYEKNAYDDAKDDEKQVDITSANSQAVRAMIDKAQLVIWDEVHRVACNTAYGISTAINNAPYRVGLSASPWRDDGADIMIEASMGPIAYKLSASDLIEQKYLVPPIIRRVKVPSSIPWYLDTRTYEQIYRDEIVNNEYRNQLILKYAMDFMDLGIPTLILVQQIKHGKKLQKLISENYHPVEFLSGRDLTYKRNLTIEEMRRGERICLIATTIADEGLDIKRLTGIILAGGGKSSTRALQRIGRVLRPFPGKTHALVVDFDDEALYLRDHSAERKRIYQTEPKFMVLEV